VIRWIDAAGCDGTVANGVGPDGTVVGVAKEPSGRVRGFILRAGEREPRLVDAPGARDTFLQDVTAGGMIIGDATNGTASGAFLLLGSSFTRVTPPGAKETWAGGILPNGDCCGSFRDARDKHVAFRRRAGRFEEVLPAGAESSVLHGLGDEGEAVGVGSLGGQLGGFLLRPDGSIEWLDPPKAQFLPSDCARGGAWIVGSFVESGGATTAAEVRDGRWRSIEIPGGPWAESAIVGCCPGVGVAGWAMGADERKRGFVIEDDGR
jgi:hypothetical protein